MFDNVKHSKPRQFSVSQAEYESRWDAILCRDLKDDELIDDKQSEKVDANELEAKI
jgi:hypothetical protein